MIEHGFVLKATGGTEAGGGFPARYGGVSIDSRTLRRGDLFFAIKAERDGHDYITDAFRAGAGAAVVEAGSFAERENPSAPLIETVSTAAALGDLALAWRKSLKNLTVVCITGSAGKTTTARALTAVLKSSGRKTVASRKSFNNHLGLPLTLLEAGEESEICVAEVGINSPGEMDRLAQIASPDAGAVTNIGTAHIGRFGDMEKIASEKARLFSAFGKTNRLAVNLDDTLALGIASEIDCEKTGFSTLHSGADVFASGIKPSASRLSFNMRIRGKDFPVTASSAGAHNVMNFLCAAALALGTGVEADEVAQGIAAFTPGEMRMDVREVKGGVTLIDDCYNANPDSVCAALEELCRLKNSSGGRAIAVLGDMLELGDLSKKYHRDCGEKAARCGVDFLIGFGAMADEVCAGAGSEVSVKKTVLHDEAADIIREIANPGDFVLVKGSRAMAMEKIVRRLETDTTG